MVIETALDGEMPLIGSGNFFYKKISIYTPVLSIWIVVDSFYLLIFYFEKF